MAKNNLFSKVISKFSIKNGPVSTKIQKSNLPELKFIFFIINWKQFQIISEVFEKENVRFHIVSQGKGTANSDILSILGIGNEEKAVIACLEQALLIPVLLKEARKELGAKSPGQGGIAFTIPLSAINDPLLLVFKESIYFNEKIPEATASTGKGRNMTKESTHDLIVSVVNNGYSDEYMNTARAAGATGGTVLHARGQAHEGLVKRFGISVQDEKEVILILCNRDKKVPIMSAVCEAHGLNSEAQGIIFSLPVDDVMSLALM